MAKNYVNEELRDIQDMIGKMRATVNESIMFNEDGGYGDDFDEKMGPREETSDIADIQTADAEGVVDNGKSAEEEGMDRLEQMGTIDQIRELTLKGMIRLCKTPEDPEYQALYKIFKMCDRSVDANVKNQEQK